MTRPDAAGGSTAAPRRGRPPSFDRTAALDRLLELFWRNGYDGATQEEMLRATGLSSSSLYRSFGTKPEIFAAALRRYLALADDLLGPLEGGTPGRADLERFLDRVEGQIGGAGSPGGCLVVTTLADPINAEPTIAELTQRHLQRMEVAIRAAVARTGRLDSALPLPTDELGAAIFAGVVGVLARAAADVDAALGMLAGVRALVRSLA